MNERNRHPRTDLGWSCPSWVVAAARDEGVGRAQQQVVRFVEDVTAITALFHDAFGIDPRQP
ncbi:hypothetical protein [Streptomyces sp. NBC_00690]|uniref:hypothetical protein n=1 Tax=Streptomyces sp. NBC_00690 TaxID=2975808 RepID=UPI002E2D4732|nr:hypothetical protein [Streptomyces sp. NBC_00690]